jgi:hypothetical protein
MNYSYEIKNNMIIEYFTYFKQVPTYKEKVESWNFTVFSSTSIEKYFSDLEDQLAIDHVAASYRRTKKWIMENHPELIL